MKFPEIDPKQARLLSIFSSFVGIIALFLLVASMVNLEFKSGESIDPDNSGMLMPTNFIETTDLLVTIFLSIIVIMVPLIVVLLAFSLEARKLLSRNLKGLMVWLVILLIARFVAIQIEGGDNLILIPGDSTSQTNLMDTSSSSGETGVLETYTAPDFSNGLGYILGFTIVFVIGIVIFIIWERNRLKKDDLGIIALKTLDEIKAGRQWEDAVIQCYAQMNAELKRKRKIDREGSMTPSEFAQILISSGLPEIPVKKLTSLFEHARYSGGGSQTSDANGAIQCLTQITRALEVSK
jgi:hypothetical protein